MIIHQLVGKMGRGGLRYPFRPRLQARSSGCFQDVFFFRSIRAIQTWKEISPRELADLEDQIWKGVGSKVTDPIVKRDLKSLQWLDRRVTLPNESSGNANQLRLLLRLPTLLHPSLHELKHSVANAASNEIESWVRSRGYDELDVQVEVDVASATPVPVLAKRVSDHEELMKQLGPGLSSIANYLAVYSCKGGVGKSTVAVNLAYELARQGGRIGLLDVDIYGPSLPILVHPDNPAIVPSPKGKGMVFPIDHKGVKLLSLGYVSKNSGVPGSGPNGGAAVMRGPMAGKVVAQLLKGTDWGELDVLILDLPPGTGDVQLSVCQELQLSGAVAVTTPSKLATEDTRKGLEMFTSLGVPTLAKVQNMSYFMCEGGGKHYPFGRGDESASNDDNNIELPISTVTNDANDSGSPVCVTRPAEASDELLAFEQLAKTVSRELLLLNFGADQTINSVVMNGETVVLDMIHFALEKETDTFTIRLFSESNAKQVRIPAANIRNRNPKTGESLDVQEEPTKTVEAIDGGMVTVHKAKRKQDPRVTPAKVEKKGKYGFAVDWGDGATIIYSMQCIARAAIAAEQSNLRN